MHWETCQWPRKSPHIRTENSVERRTVHRQEQELTRTTMWLWIIPALRSKEAFSDVFNVVKCIAINANLKVSYAHSPAAGICHSWWTRAHEGLGVCESWHTATEPGWWRVWSGCGYPAYEPAGGPAWTEGAGLKQGEYAIRLWCH